MEPLVDVRETPLSLDEVYDAVTDPTAGGIVLFVGTVRDHDEGKGVTALGYESHPTAVARLRAVVDEVAREPGVVRLAAVHRTGDLRVGDRAVVVAVSAAHRAEAFAACRRLIDRLKDEVPIWKHQQFVDGEAVWV